MPEVCEPQIRQLRSDLPQQLQVTADAAALGDGERVLDGANMGVVVLDHVAIAERPEQRDAGRHATVGAEEGAGAAVHGDTGRRDRARPLLKAEIARGRQSQCRHCPLRARNKLIHLFLFYVGDTFVSRV